MFRIQPDYPIMWISLYCSHRIYACKKSYPRLYQFTFSYRLQKNDRIISTLRTNMAKKTQALYLD